jgi:hypothetical protein
VAAKGRFAVAAGVWMPPVAEPSPRSALAKLMESRMAADF